jgi:hypothetical protein
MVVCDLSNMYRPKFVELSIDYMADRYAGFLDYRRLQDACHHAHSEFSRRFVISIREKL